MDTSKIIDALGGNKAVMELTGLSKGRISQWRNGEQIPRHWLLVFASRLPKFKAEIEAEIEARKEAAA